MTDIEHEWTVYIDPAQGGDWVDFRKGHGWPDVAGRERIELVPVGRPLGAVERAAQALEEAARELEWAGSDGAAAAAREVAVVLRHTRGW